MTEREGRVRLLVIHPRDIAAPTQGGIQTFLHDLVKYAPPEFDITVAGVTADLRARPVGRLVEVDVEGRQAWSLPLAPAGRLPRSPLGLARIALAQAPLRRLLRDPRTIVQVHRPFRPLLLAGQRGPRVQFVHLDLREWPGPSGWSRFGQLYRPFEHRDLRSASHVFVVNEPGVEILRQSAPEMASRMEFLPVWFDEQVFRPPLPVERPAARERISARLSIPPLDSEEALVLFAGRLDENKDPLLAVDAFAGLARDGVRGRLIFAGEGEEQVRVVDRLAGLGLADRAHLLGDMARDDLAELMRSVDVLLLTSHAEGGGPRVVLEALASGVPVVSPTVGDVSRTVTTGVNGWLTQTRDAAELTEGLRWALAQPREAISRAAAEGVAPYTAVNVLSRVYDVYRELSAEAATRVKR